MRTIITLLVITLTVSGYSQNDFNIIQTVDEFTGDTTISTTAINYGSIGDENLQFFILRGPDRNTYLGIILTTKDPPSIMNNNKLMLKLADETIITLYSFRDAPTEYEQGYVTKNGYQISASQLEKLATYPVARVRVEGYYKNWDFVFENNSHGKLRDGVRAFNYRISSDW